MYYYSIIVLIVVLGLNEISTIELNRKRFPDGFRIGVGTSAYQIEGGWNEDGKGENIWDRATHTMPNKIFGGENGDIACDSYHKYKTDVAMMKDLGVQHYRFSISWARILPKGFTNKINFAGVEYYRNLITELLNNGIEPVVTMYHWELPQSLQDMGGWANDAIVDRFEEYSRLVFKLYGHQVKNWLTINEPKQICNEGYGEARKAPFITSPGYAEYLCAHNVLKAHARAYRVYDREFRKEQKGQVGMAIHGAWMEPDSDRQEDKDAAERELQFLYGWFANPVMKGDYPWQMKKFIGERSIKQGFVKSRLPEFTKEEMEGLRGSVDFLGLNYYTGNMVSHKNDFTKEEISWVADAEANLYQKEEWGRCNDWLAYVPWGVEKHLKWIKATYGNIPIWITENGVSDNGTSLEDHQRIQYYQKHLSHVRNAIDDGVNVVGFSAWSLMDNFEWTAGYSDRFGLYSVDFNSPNRPRTPKKSAEFYRKFARTRCIVDADECLSEGDVDNVVRYIYNVAP